jgi:hypothetical protein
MCRITTIAVFTFAIAAFGQNNPIAADSSFQVRYASNLAAGDSYVNMTNSGATGAALPSGTGPSITGAICVNVYAFDIDEQMVSCCSCPVTPNGLRSISVRKDLIVNPLTPRVPSAVVIKLLASAPAGGSCDGSAAAPGAIVGGLLAWGSTLHADTVSGAGYVATETRFLPATLSAAEFARLTTLCNFILANGSGFGVCRSCALGGLGASKL